MTLVRQYRVLVKTPNGDRYYQKLRTTFWETAVKVATAYVDGGNLIRIETVLVEEED